MVIPALSTSDKLFICSYVIGSNVDHRLASGVMNEITTYTTEYIEGKCWIPVFSPTETNNQSNFWDVSEKDVVYVKVGVRVSADGYLHSWLLDTQPVSELILWNNKYNTANSPSSNTTTLHWALEKLYMQVIGNTTGFIYANIKFQNYVSGTTRLHMFGNNNNSVLNPVRYTIDNPAHVLKSGVGWYPNNTTVLGGDILYSYLHSYSIECDSTLIKYSDDIEDNVSKMWVYDSISYVNRTTEINSTTDASFKALPEVNFNTGDIMYIGYSTRFTGIIFNVDEKIQGNSVAWEYWDGVYWQPLYNKTDGTSGLSKRGLNTLTFEQKIEEDEIWKTCTINGISKYWLRGRSLGYTSAPTLFTARILHPDPWVDFGENGMMTGSITIPGYCSLPGYTDQVTCESHGGTWTPEYEQNVNPTFFKRLQFNSGSINIIPLCDPTDCGGAVGIPCFRNWQECHVSFNTHGFKPKGIGNNTGNGYDIKETDSGNWATCTVDCKYESKLYMQANIEGNRGYIWVDSYCNGASGSTQAICEENGGTWVPGHYECDPAKTYDTSISYKFDKWVSASPSEIDYARGRAKFSGIHPTDLYLSRFYKTQYYDIFSESEDNDLDELRNFDFTVTNTGTVENKIHTIFTKHVGVALLTDSTTPTYDANDWIVLWGTAEYFSNWQAPDGLAVRIPGTSQTLLTRPLTHHDDFYTGATDIEGGFLYEMALSNGFLSRDPGIETKIEIPVSYNTNFSWLYKFMLSDSFLSRDPGKEIKIEIPVSYDTNFNWLYKFATSFAFLSRDPGIETKIEIPVSYNTDFSWLYKLVKPKISILYHLKTDGDDTKDGLSWDNAWKHWTYMAQNIPGDYTYTVLVEEGIYNDSETQIGPDNSVIIYLVKNGLDDISTVVVMIT